MSYQIANFNQQLGLTARQWANKRYANISAELTAIATGLSTDTTTHDGTIEKPPPAVKRGPAQTYFTNACLLVVHKGKAGNLTPTALSNAITAAIASVLPPANTTAPAVSGTGTVGNALTCTMGNWTNAPTSYSYQWMRSGAKITGAEANAYTLVAADSGKNISCRVTAYTGGGSASADSNVIACA